MDDPSDSSSGKLLLIRPASGCGRRERELSADEGRVLKLAAKGLVSREIAGALDWSLDRVRSATVGAITALGASSKLEAVLVAYRRGELAAV
jgi:DNA-binding NarL/FixJ family response regulator